jgi:hypothetical protein
MDFMTFVRNQRDRVAAWCCIGFGALALLLGWLGVSGTPFPAEQIPYVVTGGLGGLFLLGVGALLWLSADLRDEWRKLDAIEELLRDGADAESVRAEPRQRSNGRSAEPAAVDEPAQ